LEIVVSEIDSKPFGKVISDSKRFGNPIIHFAIGKIMAILPILVEEQFISKFEFGNDGSLNSHPMLSRSHT
jgi:hypothetical protein